MTDAQVRLALKRSALAVHFKDPDTVVLEELGLRHGATRVDVAVVNGLLHGYEIKSERDNLSRLRQQVALYGQVLDRATLVAGPSHLEEADDIIPEWWGIQVAHGEGSEIWFEDLRAAQANPKIDPLSIAKLLWREEALQFLDELGAARGYRSKARAVIYARLIEVAEVDALRERVRRQLKSRTDWRSAR